MNKYAFVTPSGIPAYTAAPSVDEGFVDGQMYGELTCRLLPEDLDEVEAVQTRYWADDAWQIRTVAPSQHHRWDSEARAWALDLTAAKAAQWNAIKGRRTQLDMAPITVDDIEIDADARSRMDIMGAVMSMQLTGQTSIEWRCADNVMRWLTLAQVVNAGVAVAARRSALVKTSDELSQAIEAATTLEAVQAVTWP